MVNKTFLLGRLSQDPVLERTKSGAARTQIFVACERSYQSEEPVDYVPVVCWDKIAENVAKYCYQGRMVHVEGHIQVRKYIDKDGNKKSIMGVIADKVTFLDGNRKKQQESQKAPGEELQDVITEEMVNDYQIKEEDINF